MHRRRLALGLGFCLLVGTSLSVLWVYIENWLPVSYVPYYLPCPEIFNMKLQYKEEKPLLLVTQTQYPQPKLLEHRPTELLTLTPWLAPIVSEGTFNPELLQHIYQPLNLTIGVTVFAVGNSSWSPPRSSSCAGTGCVSTFSLMTLQPSPGSRWAPAGISASFPSKVTPTGRRSPCAGWRPSVSTLPGGHTGRWTISSASMWTWCSGTHGALRPWGTWWLPFTQATTLYPACSSPMNAGMFPLLLWQTVKGTSIMAGRSLAGRWPRYMSLPGPATWPSWQTKPMASWQPGRRRVT
ncbi:globoside alpha-1,3-N-acetylgalactosaminyltransferase 1 isoform X3 [Carlito syrichta]|uniref:Globoside alpha-1,3-N-acetylgalactosaminyltransferase 1 isoform X3 n=1 Tax=Carlito syrichta TaxID=1868482 RepID=A0A3Q0DQ60_CARSF|nr:globoside alpha-1,3-N-acetylgalactosaminyltransferase 1 isoform X3 [Carlito syrichta]